MGSLLIRECVSAIKKSKLSGERLRRHLPALHHMANEHTAFWLALLDQGLDAHQQARLWNGYLGWKLPPQTIVDPPDGGWPELTQEEHEILKTVAEEHGGYPEFTKGLSMKFSGHTFSDKANFSGLILIGINFSGSRCAPGTRWTAVS